MISKAPKSARYLEEEKAMTTILGIGIGVALFGYNAIVLIHAMRNRWLDKRMRQYVGR